MDKKELPDGILSVLRVSGTKLQFKELREALPQFRDLPDDEFYAILHDLHSDGMIEAEFVRTGIYSKVRAAYNIEITPRGRALTPESDHPDESASGRTKGVRSIVSQAGGFTAEDREFAQLAIDEARESVSEDDGRTHPKVGVVVVKNGRALASAHRGESLKCHAEYIALEEKLGTAALAGATVYTTLEPCTTRNHPKIPCAARLVERRVGRVVIGMLDPNPHIRGRGQLLLRQARITTDFFTSDLMEQVEELNRDFIRTQPRHDALGDWPAGADVGVAALKSPALALEVRGVSYTIQYRGAIIEVDVSNRSTSAHQITRCSLEIPSLGTTLEHSPGPPNLVGVAPWLPHAPIPLGPRKLTRGSLFFSAGTGPLRDGLPAEPLRAMLKLEFFLEPAIEREVEIYTFDTLRNAGQESQAATSDEGQHDTGTNARSPAEKLRAAAERRQKESAQKQAEQKRREALEQAALDAAPKEFEVLAELLRTRGESLSAEHLPGVPTLEFEKVNHRLDAGYTYSIELSPYAQLHSFTAIVRVGLHPSASQAHAELPNVKTVSKQFRAYVDEQGFSWVDEQGRKWPPERIIDVAFDRFTDLLSSEQDSSAGPGDERY